MVLLAGVPAVVALGSLLGIGPVYLAVFLVLPAAVALGGGGLAVLASTVSRRGRDALLTVYLVDVLFLLSPLAVLTGWTPDAAAWLGALNPFVCLTALAWGDRLMPALVSIGLWLAIGLTATAVAAWRLRPASPPAPGRRTACRAGASGTAGSRRSTRSVPCSGRSCSSIEPRRWAASAGGSERSWSCCSGGGASCWAILLVYGESIGVAPFPGREAPEPGHRRLLGGSLSAC